MESAQDQLCALASQFASLVGLGDHSDIELQRNLAICMTDALKRELVRCDAIQPDHPPTIWEGQGGHAFSSLESSAINTLNPAAVEYDEVMQDRPDVDEEDVDMTENADQIYVRGLSQESFVIELHRRILDAFDNNNTRIVNPQFKATLPMVKDLGPLMVKALIVYWDEELRQAEAALVATGDRQAPQTLALAEYCRQPQSLAEKDNANDFESAVTSIKDIIQDQKNATHARQGMKSWVWPLIQKYCFNTGQSKEVEIGNEELIYMALGERFPRGYGDYKFSQQDIEAHGLSYQRPARRVGPKNKAATKCRSRLRNYYQCLCWLRTQGHSWVFMVNVKNLFSTLSEINDPDATLGPWIELFGSLPAELSSRAFSRARGDYSGRREMILFKGLSQTENDDWNDYCISWKHSSELATFQSNTKDTWGLERRPLEDLPTMQATLEYGYRGARNYNFSWSITIRDDGEEGPCTFSTVPVKAGSFIGFLPGYCRFNPAKERRQELQGFIESHWVGLFFEDQGCHRLLSYLKTTGIGAEGNVIGGWEQFTDDLGTNSMPWCIVVFAYRDIPALTPLVLLDHMRFD